MISNATTDDGKVTINCTSTHLTSFAVLVDVSGTQGDTVSEIIVFKVCVICVLISTDDSDEKNCNCTTYLS